MRFVVKNPMKLLLTFFLIIIALYTYAQTAKDSLFVFVGEKIEVKSFNVPAVIDSTSSPGNKIYRINMDEGFKAKYRVIKEVYNHYTKDTINFEAFDHYGTPGFANYKYVMLFLKKNHDKWYHEKYQYFNVYKTLDGKWASPGNPYRFEYENKQTLKAIPIKFKEPVAFDITNLKKEVVNNQYPAPFFKIYGNKAVAVLGQHADALFEIKKNGVLKYRGYFN